jgi:hypothetical protein
MRRGRDEKDADHGGATRASCPSALELARCEAGELGDLATAAIDHHRRGCARCGANFAEVRAARTELLGDAPDQRSRRAAAEILDLAGRPSRRRWWLMLLPAAAAAGLTLYVGGRAGEEPGPGVRAKGTFALDLYCNRGERVFVPGPDTRFEAGDRLRFAYTASEPGYLAIFGVEQDGAVFPYYPGGDLGAMAVNAGTKVLLPDSIQLDDHHGDERIFALWSREPWSPGTVRRTVASALAAASHDLAKLSRLPGAAGKQISFLLRKS